MLAIRNCILGQCLAVRVTFSSKWKDDEENFSPFFFGWDLREIFQLATDPIRCIRYWQNKAGLELLEVLFQFGNQLIALYHRQHRRYIPVQCVWSCRRFWIGDGICAKPDRLGNTRIDGSSHWFVQTNGGGDRSYTSAWNTDDDEISLTDPDHQHLCTSVISHPHSIQRLLQRQSTPTMVT